MAIFTNQATLSYNGSRRNSNIVTGELQEVLTATKTAVTDDYGANDDITYVISIINSGTFAFNGLSLSDDLGAYTFNTTTVVPLEYAQGSVRYYINGVLQSAPNVIAGPPMEIEGISVPAGGNAILIYEAHTNSFADLSHGSVITNTATIVGAGIGTPLTFSENVNARSSSDLNITKAMHPSTVTEDGHLSYTFIIQNLGNTAVELGSNIVLTDTFEPIIDISSVSFNETPWIIGTNYTYDSNNGVFSTVLGQITVPAATFTRDATTGSFIVNPGVSTLVVNGTVQ